MRAGKLNNGLVFMMVSVLYSLGCSFLTEGYVQAYMLEIGMNVRQIGLYGTLCQAGALAAYALFGLYKPKNGSYMTSMFVSALGMVVLPALLLAVGLAPGLMLTILPMGALYFFAQGFRASCDYCVVPSIMPRSHYGRLSGKCGMIGSGLAALVSALGASVISGGVSGYVAMFAAAAAALLGSAAAIRLYQPMQAEEGGARRTGKGEKRWSLRTAWILLPHLMRGVSMGGFYYFVVVSMEKVELTAAGSSLIVTIGVIGTMLGSFLFMMLEKKWKTGMLTLIGNVLAGLCALLTAFNSSPVLFFVLYLGYMIFYNLSAYAIPAGVVYSVPADDLPFISSMRMLMMSVGSTVCIQLFSMLMTVWPSWTIMAISAVVFTVAGVIFRIQYTDSLKK